MASEKTRIVNNVSITCIIVNMLLSIGKIIVGIVGHSSAIITDAVNSIGDVISTIIIIVGNKVSEKASDEEHPYGHDRYWFLETNSYYGDFKDSDLQLDDLIDIFVYPVYLKNGLFGNSLVQK